MRFHIDQPPCPRNRRVIGRHLVQPHPQKIPQPQRIRRPPRNPPFAVDALEISDQQQAEISPRCQTGPPHLLRVEARTLLLHVLVKAALLQQPVQLLVEGMPHRPRQIRVRDPKFLLSSLLLSSAHSHARILRTSAVDHTIFFLRNPDLHHGLLGPSPKLLGKPGPLPPTRKSSPEWQYVCREDRTLFSFAKGKQDGRLENIKTRLEER